MKIPRDGAQSASAFHGGAFFEAIGEGFEDLSRRHAIVNADVVDAWYDPAPGALAAIRNDSAWLCRTSPPIRAEGLRATITEVRGVPQENLLVGGGSSDLIFLAIPRLLGRGERAAILDPMYGEYAHVIESVIGGEIARIPLKKEDGFRLDPADFLAAASGAALAILVNPNNPTGRAEEVECIETILEGLDPATLLLVDETYVDYLPSGLSSERRVPGRENLLVMKSMSKFYALSGLRVGYLAGPRAIVERLERFSPPWAVSLLGQVAGVEALRDEPYYRARVEETHRLRRALIRGLDAFPELRTYPSTTNFVLVEILDPGWTSRRLDIALRERGIYIRDCDSQGTRLGGRFVRIAVKESEANERILAAVRGVLETSTTFSRAPSASA